MNKKRLSVVMAGAMLASSVAPIMAAEEVSVTEIQKGNLINEITDLLWDAPKFSNDYRVDSTRRNKSVYTVKINGAENSDIYDLTVSGDNAVLKSALQKKVQEEINKLAVGAKVELVDLGSQKVTEGNNELILSKEKTTKYTAAELENTGDFKDNGSVEDEIKNSNAGNSNAATVKIIKKHGHVAGKGYVIELTEEAAKTAGKEKIELTTDSARLDFTNYIKTDGSKAAVPTTEVTDFLKFATAEAKYVDIADKVEKTYKIATDGTTLALSDIFDGVMLTEKGYALLNAAKETNYVVAAKKASNASTAKEDIVKVGGDRVLSTGMASVTADKNGVYTVKLEIANANMAAEEAKDGQAWTPKSNQFDTYYITGTSKAQLTKVLSWIDALSADVEELAGSDRYSTAVRIAKEVASLTGVADDEDVVLVNGNSLVDGLAAAPLAKHLAGATTAKNAPILLTENDKLPTATKKYLAELVDTAKNKTVTVNIVGGTGVVSKSVEKELRAMNIKVERFGGEDREATSMAVAEEIGFDNGAFVVGATGEADAMSIAGKAAELEAPIVVSGFNGLSEETLESLEGARVNVIGGDSAVSAADYAAIKDVALTLGRVSGSDRKETNAEVIRRFYNGSFATSKSVIVAKDDVLIDALTASNLASQQSAPIVLATSSLSANQIEAIDKNANKANKVYQVGYGVERSVVKLVAQALELI